MSNQETYQTGANVANEFGGRLRVRACGLCFEGEKILLLNHRGIYGHDFWAPPGGGVNFGESIESALQREFREECQVSIRVGNFVFGCEFIRAPFHAVELFYEVDLLNRPRLGIDPEMSDHQVISDLKFMGEFEIKSLSRDHVHGIFNRAKKPSELRRLSGFFSLP